ncbi:LytR/AlgR family response regulator transcription factor [Fibrella aquatilis]|uniref:Response regulator transcription factor n=1 Tax=Fibrella aquatilis TaxID=2817059 RepID=A0A939G0B8_9BACT|nr:LytTR family DNA-binding domain-containing protein [Fibrella aquatilis]MBO0930042.1 response regulator transcription factor [Fibrella aquatilis]
MTPPMRCLVVDDKPLAIDILTDYVSKVPFLQLVGATTNPLDALSWVTDRTAELVFLDIQMPQLTGIQFMNALHGRAGVILTTAYAEYALDGFEHDVIDYLLKPISFERFYRAVQKAQSQLRAAPAPTDARPYLFVRTEHKMQRVDLQAVLYVEGLQNYVLLHTPTEKIIARQTIASLEKALPAPAFVRVHKSFIVALAHIHTVERNRIVINGSSGNTTVIPVGDAYREAFHRML